MARSYSKFKVWRYLISIFSRKYLKFKIPTINKDEHLIIDYQDPDLEEYESLSGGPFYFYKGLPFSGMLCEYFDNDILHIETNCVDGRPEGVSREYFQNGQLMEESFTKYNLEYGVMKEWDENGNLLSEYDWGPEPVD